MQIFLDTADLASIERARKTGLIDGITTNPTLLSRELAKFNGDSTQLLKKICDIMETHDVSVEVTEQTAQAVYNQAKKIAKIASNIVVKIPCQKKYLEVIKQLIDEGVAINITLLFSVAQGLLMCKLGVKYISPFVGRVEDFDANGIELIEDLKTIVDNYDFETQILAASIRNIMHVHEVALAGADIVTIPVELFDKLLEHPLTELGVERFDADWKKLGISQFP